MPIGTEIQKKLCFVAMGFGKKTDFETQRILDLDQTYDEIIKPAVEAAGLRCIRADGINHSGMIDVKMYEMLLRADLVVADISTANPNAIYELGVRHALRPFSTIVIKEDQGRFHFDLNHLATLTYRHLGEEIGAKEARNKTEALRILIEEILSNPQADSPVYTFLPGLAHPKFSDAEFERLIDQAEESGERLAEIISRAKSAAEASDHNEAEKFFRQAASMTSDNNYLIQQRALHRYKSGHPSEFVALTEARAIIEALNPSESRDAETLGIVGAICQRLWKLSGDRAFLDQAINFYRSGYSLREDYYNGENFAMLLEQRSMLQVDSNERLFDEMLAKKIRELVIVSLKEIVNHEDFPERGDKRWILATLSSCYLSVDELAEADVYKARFEAESPAEWETKTFERGQGLILEYKSR